jgi:hypothetical protein
VRGAPKFHNLDRAKVRFRIVQQRVGRETLIKHDSATEQECPEPDDQ